jgi:hypothetical protein
MSLACYKLIETREGTYLSTRSLMIHQSRRSDILFFGIRTESLGQDDYTLSIDIVSFEEFAQDDLGFSVRVYIGCIE